jgi:hypothetical protein
MQDSILYNISSVATWRRSWNLERWRLRPWYGSRRPEVRPRDSTILLGKDGKRWWTCDFVHSFFKKKYGYESKPWYLVNPKIAGKWMFIPLKMVLIGIDPYPYIYIHRFSAYCLVHLLQYLYWCCFSAGGDPVSRWKVITLVAFLVRF